MNEAIDLINYGNILLSCSIPHDMHLEHRMPAHSIIFVRSGKLKVLAVMSNERLAAQPDVPTFKECGYNAVLGTWRGLGVPAATPDEVVNELYRIFSEAAASDQFKEFMANTNNVIEIQDGKTFEKTIADQLALYKELVDSLGLKVK